MLYRVTIDLAFEQEGQARGLVNHAQGLLGIAVNINPDTEEEEIGYIKLVECFHDEDPSQPCAVVEQHLVPY